MKSLTINLMFWTDAVPNSTRERNVKYTTNELKNLCEYLSTRNIACDYRVYDYSPSQIVEGSIHVPYPSTAFKKSEKINNILKETNSDLFAIMDSDCFVCKEDYETLGDILEQASVNSCITFDVLDFTEPDTQLIVNDNVNPFSLHNNVSARFEGRAGGLGALFITNTDNLKFYNGFNEKFTTWGGEDGEIYDKIYRDGNIQKIPCNNKTVRLYHLSHFSDRENINYFNTEEYIRNNY